MISTRNDLVVTWFVLFSSILLTDQPGFAQVQTEWVARYSRESSSVNFPSALALDIAGNVYVTGGSSYGTTDGTTDHAITIKYDSFGNEVWVKDLCVGDNGSALAIVVDAKQNVYLTGSCGGVEARHATTAKYGVNGDLLWTVNGFGGDAIALSIDSTGNVYITGSNYNLNHDGDYATTKYDSNGNELWVAYYNGPRDGDDQPAAIAVDPTGNVYVTGSSYGDDDDYATVKYDKDGNQLWVARYSSSGMNVPTLIDRATAIAVDSLGNVYVTGVGGNFINIHGSYSTYTTLKYDTNGNQQWMARYTGPPVTGSFLNGALALAVDPTGNAYVTGYSFGGNETADDYATIKYDANGNQLWVKRYNGPGNDSDVAFAMALDTEGNVYVTGGSYGSGTGDDYATVKYDPDGNQIWVSRYNGPGNVDEKATAIAVDTLGNVYVTGESGGQFATIKLSQVNDNSNGGNPSGNSNGSSGCFITTAGNGSSYLFSFH